MKYASSGQGSWLNGVSCSWIDHSLECSQRLESLPMPNNQFSSKFVASQIAGSCRIEGIRVSVTQERIICEVIDGKTDAKILRRQLVAKFKAANAG